MAGIDATAPSPRVNFGLLPQFIGKRVSIVGKVEALEGTTLKLRTSDDGVVIVNLSGIAPQVRGAPPGDGWRRRARAARAAVAFRLLHPAGPGNCDAQPCLPCVFRVPLCRRRCWRWWAW